MTVNKNEPPSGSKLGIVLAVLRKLGYAIVALVAAVVLSSLAAVGLALTTQVPSALSGFLTLLLAVGVFVGIYRGLSRRTGQ